MIGTLCNAIFIHEERLVPFGRPSFKVLYLNDIGTHISQGFCCVRTSQHPCEIKNIYTRKGAFFHRFHERVTCSYLVTLFLSMILKAQKRPQPLRIGEIPYLAEISNDPRMIY